MNPEVKTRWTQALRSKYYKQGRGNLKNSKNELCCLGVLATIQGVPSKLVNDTNYYEFDFNPVEDREFPHKYLCSAFPTYEWMRAFGLEPIIASKLAQMNDSGASFEEIADKIEEIA